MSSIIVHLDSRLEVSQAALLRRVLHFNYGLSADIHSSFADVFDGPQTLIARLRNHPRSVNWLTQKFNKRTGFMALMPQQFSSPILQVALLSSNDWIRLIQFCVAALLCDSICKEVSRYGRTELEQTLPSDVLLFARHRCRLTARPVAQQMLNVLPPDVLNLAELDDSPQTWPARMERVCRVVCGSLWHAYPEAIRSRVALKLPRTWQPTWQQLLLSDLATYASLREDQPRNVRDSSDLAWRLALRLLETEMLRNWKACFN